MYSIKKSQITKISMFSFNTFSGVMKMYLAAVRRSGGQVEVTSRMLRPGEDGLGGQYSVKIHFLRTDIIQEMRTAPT